MPRSQVSRADEVLIAALADGGLRVSPYQLERWRTAGLLPRNQRQSLGRGRGSVSAFDDTTLSRAKALAEFARQGRAMPGGHVIERFARGEPVSEARVRAAFAGQLDRVARKFAVDVGEGDQGWQARYQAADGIARSAGLFNWNDLVDALTEKPERARMSPADERAATRTTVQLLADLRIR